MFCAVVKILTQPVGVFRPVPSSLFKTETEATPAVFGEVLFGRCDRTKKTIFFKSLNQFEWRGGEDFGDCSLDFFIFVLIRDNLVALSHLIPSLSGSKPNSSLSLSQPYPVLTSLSRPYPVLIPSLSRPYPVHIC